jgi:hypothetical protein
MKTLKIPSWYAWKNVIPGSKPTLHIHGVAFAPTLCDEPYLEPQRGPTPLVFALKFKRNPKAGKFCPEVVVPKDVDYQQKISGTEKEVLIEIPGQKKPTVVPIKTIS